MGSYKGLDIDAKMMARIAPILQQPISILSVEARDPESVIEVPVKKRKKKNILFDIPNLRTDWKSKIIHIDKVFKHIPGEEADVIEDLDAPEVDPYVLNMSNEDILGRSLYDQKVLDEHEMNFVKWLNNLIRHNANPNMAFAKAIKVFRSNEIMLVLSKCAFLVESRMLVIKADLDIHTDLELQRDFEKLLRSYEMTWLNLGLRILFNKRSSKLNGRNFTKFLRKNLYFNAYLAEKYQNLQSAKYSRDIKKFILKKILTLIYFLDKAKIKGVHPVNLFNDNARNKESSLILKKFMKFYVWPVYGLSLLKAVDYTLEYEQHDYDEYDYTVRNIQLDLRDGVRLAKITGILLNKHLMDEIMIYPQYRSQRMRNLTYVFAVLQDAGFYPPAYIGEKDINYGARIKTLSLLWHLEHKFRSPRLVVAATLIQHWWRRLSRKDSKREKKHWQLKLKLGWRL